MNPGTRHAADPAYKVVRRGALPYSSTIMVAKMSDSILGIDVSKETLDAYCARGQRKQGRTFANSPDGWKLVRDRGESAWHLYDLNVDESELHDVIADNVDRAHTMEAMWDQWASANQVLPKP